MRIVGPLKRSGPPRGNYRDRDGIVARDGPHVKARRGEPECPPNLISRRCVGGVPPSIIMPDAMSGTTRAHYHDWAESP